MTRLLCVSALSFALIAASPTSPIAQAPAGSDANATLRTAFTAAYNLDYPEAIGNARKAAALDPNNPRVQRGLATIVWLQILFRRGAVSIDHYLGSISKSQKTLPKPDPESAEEFKRAIGRAIELANARLKANPNDLQAKFDAGAAYGLQASYVASVEGSVMSAFGIAKRAYKTQDEVLTLDSSRVAAGVVVGTYRYIISTLNPAMRTVAWFAGFEGGKKEGIALLEAAVRDSEARIDAQAALMLIYSREGRHAEVVKIAHDLGTEFPRNRLFQLEEGAAAIRAGRAADADSVLTRGIDALKKDSRPKIPAEEATWYYKRGLARLNQNHPAPASADLQHALGAMPSDWIRGKIHVEVGKLADLAGRRQDALAAYRTAKTLCENTDDTLCAKEADRWMRKPFSFGG